MRSYTLNELMILTRAELFALRRRIVDALAQLPGVTQAADRSRQPASDPAGADAAEFVAALKRKIRFAYH